MPNWCECHFEVENLLPSEKEVMEQHIKTNTLFSHYIPEPDWSSIPNDKGELPAEEEVKNKNGEVICHTHRFPDGTQDIRWYGWHCAQWGTKWDINEGDIPLTPEEDGGTLQANFLTAWSPPQEGVRALSEMFPDATFYLSYVETGNDFMGVSLFKNGEMVEKDAEPSDIKGEWMNKNHPNAYDEEEEDFNEEALEAFWDVEFEVYESVMDEMEKELREELVTA